MESVHGQRVPIRKTFWRWAAPAYTMRKLTLSKQVLPPGVLSQFTSSKKPSSAVWILWLFSLPHFLMDHPVLLWLFFARTPTFILPPVPSSIRSVNIHELLPLDSGWVSQAFLILHNPVLAMISLGISYGNLELSKIQNYNFLVYFPLIFSPS